MTSAGDGTDNDFTLLPSWVCDDRHFRASVTIGQRDKTFCAVTTEDRLSARRKLLVEPSLVPLSAAELFILKR